MKQRQVEVTGGGALRESVGPARSKRGSGIRNRSESIQAVGTLSQNRARVPGNADSDKFGARAKRRVQNIANGSIFTAKLRCSRRDEAPSGIRLGNAFPDG